MTGRKTRRFYSSRASLGVALLCSASVGCGDDDDFSSSGNDLTIVEVVPEAFLGSVPCGAEPGAVAVYVATLVDLGPVSGTAGRPSTDFVLPSSSPAGCTRSVAFGSVVGRHEYRALIEGYDRSDLVQPAAGVPILLDPESGEIVPPRWTAECAPTTAEFRLTRRVTDCSLFTPTNGEDSTAIELQIDETWCTQSELSLEEFSVRRAGTEVARLGCGESARWDVRPGDFVQLDLLAFEAGAESPALGAVCSATAAAGIVTRVSCGTLSAQGSVRVRLADVYAALGLECSETLQSLVLRVAESDRAPIEVGDAGCRGIAQFDALPAGSYTVEASATPRSDAEPLQAVCTAEVEPGLSANAACSGG
ncbi:MAG TPA: hypothetical protein VIM73_21785 [Polyangiaceae bacterium]